MNNFAFPDFLSRAQARIIDYDDLLTVSLDDFAHVSVEPLLNWWELP